MSRAEEELSALRRLATRHGVALAHDDTAGQTVPAEPEVLVGVLRALGVEVDSVGDATRLRDATPRSSGVEPVEVVAAGRGSTIDVDVDGSVRWQLWDADGSRVAEGAGPGPIRLEALPVGFFDLDIDIETRVGSDQPTACRVLSSPGRAWVEPELRGGWGVFAPLHAVRRPDSAGHLGDVRALAGAIGPHGGRTVAVLPLLATFLGDDPHEHSPYQPVSRSWFSALYLDPQRLPVDVDLDLPSAPPTSDDLIDHAALEARAEALVARVRAALEHDARASSGLDEFTRRRPEVRDYAAFRAAVERHGPHPSRLDGDPDRVTHHVVVQWLADHQLTALRADLGADGQALALDLPVGSHPEGYDTFAHPNRYAPAAVGAPPDDFFTGGQNWGFPPPHPVRSRADGHRVLTDPAEALARHAGVLRIDHVLGLHRLWWVPDGGRADQGAYVHYPLDELLAATCIVSHLHQTVIVGENLGTVPPEVTEALDRHDIAGMHEEQFVIGDPTAGPLPSISSRTVAGVNTHDMATFAGFWEGHDLELQETLGQLATDAVEPARRRRRDAIARYRRLVADALGHPVGDDRVSVLAAAVERLARSDADQVMVTLEDLWGETRPQNVPGTHREVPNWRRRMTRPLDEALDGPGAAAVIDVLAEHRGRASDEGGESSVDRPDAAQRRSTDRAPVRGGTSP